MARELFCLLIASAAVTWSIAVSAVEIEWVTVGDPGNDADTEIMNDGTTGYGAVWYLYAMSTYEITNAQYAEFLSAVAATDTNALYNQNMGNPSPGEDGYGGITRSGTSGTYGYSAIGGREDMPVNFVSFYDALRFANWLHNGQPTGIQDNTSTEDGAYTFSGPETVTARRIDATVFVPSEDEWYKAAFYDPVGDTYFDYPAGFDATIACTTPSPATNSANCARPGDDFTDVGSYTGSASPNGTFDQAGNVSEWDEAIVFGVRSLRGGGFDQPDGVNSAEARMGDWPYEERNQYGFRVAPEPEAMLQLAAGIAALLMLAQRRSS